jgi:HAD superfamily hydrolase (TIGR01509 family)
LVTLINMRQSIGDPLMFTILWDNDGVLVDTEGLYFRATQAVLAEVGVELTAQQFKEISLRRGESTFLLAAEKGIPADDISCLRAKRDRIYAESLRTEPCVVDGAKDVLRSLYGHVRMGVVTSTFRPCFDIAHARTGLTKYLDFVITHEDYQHTKPHPDPYLTALSRHRVRRENCIVAEDSERGLVAATAAGLGCIIVLSEWTKDGDFRNAHKILQSISEVPNEILRFADVEED